jgi:DnaJ-related protein SCJ1
MKIKIKMSLEDLYNGKEMEVKYTRNVICPHCRGSGADDPEDVRECPKCKGQGVTMRQQQLAPGFVQQFQEQCGKCAGTGRIKTSTCHVCSSKKTMNALDDIYVFVERGTPDGHEESFKDAADEFVDQRAGDVIMKVIQLPHPRFTRERNEDLRTSMNITLLEALTGFTRTLEHLDGHEVEIKTNPGQVCQHGEVRVLSEEGMPKYGAPSDYGDLFVGFNVENPKTLTEDQREQLSKLFKSM